MAAHPKLTERQRQFVEAYLLEPNATAAAAKAGYRQPNKQGPRLLVNVGVAAALAAARADRSRRTAVEADQVLRELAVVGFSNVDHYQVDGRGRLALPDGADLSLLRAVSSVKRKVRRILGADDTERIEEIETEIRLWPKVEALRLLAQHLGMLKEQVEHTGKDGGAIPITFIEFVDAKPRAVR